MPDPSGSVTGGFSAATGIASIVQSGVFSALFQQVVVPCGPDADQHAITLPKNETDLPICQTNPVFMLDDRTLPQPPSAAK